MSDRIHIQMMNSFLLYVNDQPMERLVNKSRKGVTLVGMLLLNRGRQVANYRLLECLWSGDRGVNPENALKTLVSRMRQLLNELSPGLGKCIVADRGAYHWESAPEMSVDLYRIDALLEKLERHGTAWQVREESMRELLRLYSGDLLRADEQSEWALSESVRLHERYVAAVHAYLDALRDAERWEDMARAAEQAARIEPLDHHLREKLSLALSRAGEAQSAAVESEAVDGARLDESVARVREILASDMRSKAMMCDFDVFRSLYSLQVRNAERIDRPLMMAVIRNGSGAEDSLKDALIRQLRDGDVFSCAPDGSYVVMMPACGYAGAAQRIGSVTAQLEKSAEGGGLNVSLFSAKASDKIGT